MGEDLANHGVHLPPRSISEPRFAFVSPAFVVSAFAFTCGVASKLMANHIFGVLASFAVAFMIWIVIVGVLLGVILSVQRRGITRAMATMPPHGIYKGRATLIPLRGEGRIPKSGMIVLDTHGITWTPSKGAGPIFATSWDRVERIELRPDPWRAGTMGQLRIDQKSNSPRTLLIGSFGLLASILQQHA